MIGDTKAKDLTVDCIWEEDEEVVERFKSKLMQILNEEYSENSYIKRLNISKEFVKLWSLFDKENNLIVYSQLCHN